MPPKRPAPLSDAALSRREGGADATPAAALGETNAGVPLPVKNTFIDVPSGLTPVHFPGKKDNPLRTAPAQVNFAPGFVQRSVLASAQLPPPAPPEAPPPLQLPSASPKKGGVPGVVQRPGFLCQDWPLMTPSPTGSSMFAAQRYQLFGGPAPVQEATHSAMGPVAAQPQQSGVLATQGPPYPPIPGRMTVGPLSYGTSTFASHFAPPAQIMAPIAREAQAVCRPAAGSAGSSAVPPAPLGRVEQEDSNAEEEAEDDSDGDAPQQQQQPLRSPEDVPKPPPGALHPSIGSESHEEGTCKRCCFFPRNRCNNGYDCDFCHYEHEKRKRKNKKSKKKNKAGQEEASSEATAGGTGPGAAGDATATPASEPEVAAGAPDLWSTSYLGGAPHLQGAGAQSWQDPHFPQAAPLVPRVVYENTDGSPQWTYQWIDVPRQLYPGQFPETPAHYFAPAAGLLPGAGGQSLPGADQALMAGSLPSVQPLYSQPPLQYSGAESSAQHWGPQPHAYPGAGPAMAADAVWQPPYPAPPYQAMGTDPALHLQAAGHEPGQPPAAQASAAQSPAPPPRGAPKLPEALHRGPGTTPPPQGAPTLPPTVEDTEEEEDPKPPPPISSPKLSNNLLRSLQQLQDEPPVPGDPPI